MKRLLPRLLLLAFIGAASATLCDFVHAYTETLIYPDEGKIGIQAWWVFPGFFFVFFSIALSYFGLSKVLGAPFAMAQSRSQGSLSAFIEALIVFMIVYMASGVGNAFPTELSLIFYLSFLLRWSVSYERAWLLLLAVLLAMGGMFSEGMLGAFKLVEYQHVDVFHVPWWLGGLYVHGAFAVREGMRALVFKDACS